MTDSPAVEQKKSRRGLLALVGAGGAAAVAALLGRRNRAEALPGDNLVLGDDTNDSGSLQTKVTGTWVGTGDEGQFHVENNSGTSYRVAIRGDCPNGRGVVGTGGDYGVQGEIGTGGYAGVFGRSAGSSPAVSAYNGGDGVGARVDSKSGDAVRAVRASVSGTGAGVQGFSGVSESAAADRVGVRGVGADTGVYGKSGGGGGLAVGVHGVADDIGVLGASAANIGVKGSGTTMGVWGEAVGTGVKGHSNNGTGVKGTGKPGVYGISGKDNGAGVRGEGDAPGSIGVLALNTPKRRALRTKGKVHMDCARKVTLSNRDNLVTLPTGVRADTNAIVLATVQGAPGNYALVRRAFRVDSTHIRIDFDKKPDNPTAVGYWVVHTG